MTQRVAGESRTPGHRGAVRQAHATGRPARPAATSLGRPEAGCLAPDSAAASPRAAHRAGTRCLHRRAPVCRQRGRRAAWRVRSRQREVAFPSGGDSLSREAIARLASSHRRASARLAAIRRRRDHRMERRSVPASECRHERTKRRREPLEERSTSPSQNRAAESRQSRTPCPCSVGGGLRSP